MFRRVVLASIAVLALASTANAQDWARKMFDATDHNFGAVARGATARHYFRLTNIFKEDVHISSVRSSCGCTSVEVSKDTLKTYESASVTATFNTASHLGQKSATLTVVIDRPYYAEVQLHVAGYIRSDLTLSPPGVNLGAVDSGAGAVHKIEVAATGRPDWRIEKIKVSNPEIEAEAVETARSRNVVKYTLTVKVKESMPVGYVKELVNLVTNDASNAVVPVDVEGQVVAEVAVRPSSLFLGTMTAGSKVEKKVVVKGKKPFKILAVECDDEGFEFTFDPAVAKEMHLLPVQYTAGGKAGQLNAKIKIRVDTGHETTVVLGAQAVVDAAPATASAK